VTPTEITDAARDIYNASGDTFFADTQMFNWLWQGCHEFARKAWLIERIYSTTTVAGTADYSFPTYTLAIKRVTVNGRKLKRITHREDDSVTYQNSASLVTGPPAYYTEFNSTIYLRPTPDDVYTMQVHSFDDHPPITAVTTLSVPTLFHFDLVDHVLWRMFAKDKDIPNAQMHMGLWQQHVADAISFQKRKRRTDSFATVQCEETLPVTVLGES
jgi:hypothetical protein